MLRQAFHMSIRSWSYQVLLLHQAYQNVSPERSRQQLILSHGGASWGVPVQADAWLLVHQYRQCSLSLLSRRQIHNFSSSQPETFPWYRRLRLTRVLTTTLHKPPWALCANSHLIGPLDSYSIWELQAVTKLSSVACLLQPELAVNHSLTSWITLDFSTLEDGFNLLFLLLKLLRSTFEVFFWQIFFLLGSWQVSNLLSLLLEF